MQATRDDVQMRGESTVRDAALLQLRVSFVRSTAQTCQVINSLFEKLVRDT